MAEAEEKGKGELDESGSPPVERKEPSCVTDEDVSVDILTARPRLEVLKVALKAHSKKTRISVFKDYVDLSPVPFWDPSELSLWSFWRAGIAEFVASFLFLYITVQTAIGSAADGTGGVGTIGVASVFGITIFVLVYAIAGISGGHINPIITFAFLLVRKVSFARCLIFVIAQVLGSLAGVGLVVAYQKGHYQRFGGGANWVHHGYSKGAGFAAELVGSFFLVYVVFAASDSKRRQRDAHVPVLAPLAIGMVVFIIHLATIPITGTGINPARSFATACYWNSHDYAKDHAWNDQWIFWVAPLLGATIAAMYYQYIIRAIPFRDGDLKSLKLDSSRLTG